MNRTGHIGFLQPRSSIRERIYIPRFYNVEISERLNALVDTHHLISIEDLIQQDHMSTSTGHEVGKMAYGTGSIPFVRTSDISNWEIKTDPKQGVSQEIYEQYALRQDVQPDDLFFVRDGTYLIGQTCLVSSADAKLLFQSHILKFRVNSGSPISAPLLLALLSTDIVRSQVRSKQFTADIIDTIGHRFKELVLPVPKDQAVRSRIADSVRSIVDERMALRERLRRIPLWAEGSITGPDDPLPSNEDEVFELDGDVGFLTNRGSIRKGVYVPRYYNPQLERDLRALESTHSLVSLEELVEKDVLGLSTGTEVGKMAYGRGNLPFIRTSDISNWELKSDPKQLVDEEQFEAVRLKLDVRAGDIFIVRDGTYLVGTSAIVTPFDPNVLFAGGLYKIRVHDPDALDPYLLLALLNTPLVRRQMRAKQFTRDIIDTLGHRILEVVLPVPKCLEMRKQLADVTRDTIISRARLRDEANRIVLRIERSGPEEAEDLALGGQNLD